MLTAHIDLWIHPVTLFSGVGTWADAHKKLWWLMIMGPAKVNNYTKGGEKLDISLLEIDYLYLMCQEISCRSNGLDAMPHAVC